MPVAKLLVPRTDVFKKSKKNKCGKTAQLICDHKRYCLASHTPDPFC